MYEHPRPLVSSGRQRLFSVTFASLLITACGGGSTDDAGRADAGGTPVDAGSTLSCLEIFECISACPDSACEDACIERGTPDALALATALAVCADANSCTTEACLSASCADEVLACAAVGPLPDGGLPDGGVPDGGGPSCSPGVGVPELTGALGGLSASYGRGETITVNLAVDEDTRRAIVTIYQYGSPLMLGSVATEVSSTVASLSLPAGTDAAPVGTYYLQVELCSTSLCASPLSRTSYDRVGVDTSYTETRIQPGLPTESCPSGIPITTFTIN